MITFDLPLDTFVRLSDLSVHGNATEMNNLRIIEEQDKIESIVSTFMHTTHYHYGNLFSHAEPFTTHADISDLKRTILLMPIKASPEQHFMVFDQTIDRDKPISWIWNLYDDKTDEELAEMYYLSSEKVRPCETPELQNVTDEPVSDELFQHLPFTKDLPWTYRKSLAV